MKDVKDFFGFHLKRHSARMSRELLELIEDLEAEQIEHSEKLKFSLPEKYHNNVDQYFLLTEQRKQRIRKRILDSGGNFVREILLEIDKLDIKLK